MSRLRSRRLDASAATELLSADPSVVVTSPGTSDSSEGIDGLVAVWAIAGAIVLVCLVTLAVIWRRRRLAELAPLTPAPSPSSGHPNTGRDSDQEEARLSLGIGYVRFALPSP
jgi:hypothetical protein